MKRLFPTMILFFFSCIASVHATSLTVSTFAVGTSLTVAGCVCGSCCSRCCAAAMYECGDEKPCSIFLCSLANVICIPCCFLFCCYGCCQDPAEICNVNTFDWLPQLDENCNQCCKYLSKCFDSYGKVKELELKISNIESQIGQSIQMTEQQFITKRITR